MPTNQELAVILKFRDEATAAFKRAVASVHSEVETLSTNLRGAFQRAAASVHSEVKDLSAYLRRAFKGAVASVHSDVEALSAHLRRMSSTLRETGRNITQVGAVLTGPFLVALAATSGRSIAVHSTLINLKGSLAAISDVLANAVLPIVNQFADTLNHLVKRLREMDPATRDVALRMVFLAGVLAGVVGPLTSLVARLVKLTAIFFGFVAALNPAQAAITALVIAVIALLAYTGQLGNAFALLARVLDFVVNALAQLIELALLPARVAIEALAGSLRILLVGLSLIPGPFKQSREAIAEWAKEVERSTRRAMVEGGKNFMAFGKQAMEAAAGTGKGAGAPFSEMARGAKKMIDEMRKLLSPGAGGNIAKGFMESFKSTWEQFLVEATDLGKKAATAMTGFFQTTESVIAKSIENALLHGGKLKDVFRSIARGIVQAFASMIAQLIAAAAVFLILSAIPGMTAFLKFLDTAAMLKAPIQVAATSAALANASAASSRSARVTTVHSGGFIQRFATGGEVLAMLEPGEFVVNRRSTERNRELLESINSGRGTGEQGGGKGIAVVFNINAIDPKTGAEFLLRNSKAIADAVGQEILRNNQSYRRTSRRFA